MAIDLDGLKQINDTKRPPGRRRAHPEGRRLPRGRSSGPTGTRVPHRRRRVHGPPPRPAELARADARATDRPGDPARTGGRAVSHRPHRVDRDGGSPPPRAPGRRRALRGEADEAERRRLSTRASALAGGRRTEPTGRRTSSARSPRRSRARSTRRTAALAATRRRSPSSASRSASACSIRAHQPRAPAARRAAPRRRQDRRRGRDPAEARARWRRTSCRRWPSTSRSATRS